MSSGRHFDDGSVEGGLIHFRRRACPADFANELQSGGGDFVRGNRIVGAAKNFNTAAHRWLRDIMLRKIVEMRLSAFVEATPTRLIAASLSFGKIVPMDVFQEGLVRGFLHTPAQPATRGLVLTHGAGGNCKAALLIKAATLFCEAGYCVLRCDLPFRQRRPFGPPTPAMAAQDREGLRAAVNAMRKLVPGAVTLAGHSYGGRQATMLAAEEPGLCEALMLFSYPLHPPDKPAQLRTAHFPALQTPALFVHGTKDPFGTPAEITTALQPIPVKKELLTIEGAGHDLKQGKFDDSIWKTITMYFGNTNDAR